MAEGVAGLDLEEITGGGGEARDGAGGVIDHLGAGGGGVGDEVVGLAGVQDVGDLTAGGVVVEGGQPVELDAGSGERVGLHQLDPRGRLARGRGDGVDTGGDAGGIEGGAGGQGAGGEGIPRAAEQVA